MIGLQVAVPESQHPAAKRGKFFFFSGQQNRRLAAHGVKHREQNIFHRFFERSERVDEHQQFGSARRRGKHRKDLPLHKREPPDRAVPHFGQIARFQQLRDQAHLPEIGAPQSCRHPQKFVGSHLLAKKRRIRNESDPFARRSEFFPAHPDLSGSRRQNAAQDFGKPVGSEAGQTVNRAAVERQIKRLGIPIQSQIPDLCQNLISVLFQAVSIIPVLRAPVKEKIPIVSRKFRGLKARSAHETAPKREDFEGRFFFGKNLDKAGKACYNENR